MKHKSILYKNEQNLLIDQLIEILELDENNQITLYELDNNKEKTDKIMALVPNMRKYFSFSSIIGLESPEQVKRPWLSIIRQIPKSKYIMKRKTHRIYKEKNIVIQTSIYTFIDK